MKSFKKLLSLSAAFGLSTVATTSVVACGKIKKDKEEYSTLKSDSELNKKKDFIFSDGIDGFIYWYHFYGPENEFLESGYMVQWEEQDKITCFFVSEKYESSNTKIDNLLEVKEDNRPSEDKPTTITLKKVSLMYFDETNYQSGEYKVNLFYVNDIISIFADFYWLIPKELL